MELTVIMKKLGLIQDELFVPKGQRNNFGNYSYRSCEDILKNVKPLASKNGCVIHLDTEMIREGEFNYVKATAYLTDVESGAFISAKGFAREEAAKKGMDGSQISGSATSYARKYALAGLFCIDNEKDSDATNDGADKLEPSQVAKIKEELERTGISEASVTSRYKKDKLEELTQDDYVKAIKILAKAATKEA